MKNHFLVITLSVIASGDLLAANAKDLEKPFSHADREAFAQPPPYFRPETWFHYIGGNVSTQGITADLEAISSAGFSGIQLFHGQFGGKWPETGEPIACLSEKWDGAVKHTGEEARRLGLRFTMQNCPGWAMAGGPWITASNAMRTLVWSRLDVSGNTPVTNALAQPQPSTNAWHDYRDIAVLAFPTPRDDTNQPLKPLSVRSNREDLPWLDCLTGQLKKKFSLVPDKTNAPTWVEVTFEKPVTIRSLELPPVQQMNHDWCYVPGITVTLEAKINDQFQTLLETALPPSSWQDNKPITLAVSELSSPTYRISFNNKHNLGLSFIRLWSAARKNNWESEAASTLRRIERSCANPLQEPDTWLKADSIVDLTPLMDAQGVLAWTPPSPATWTILRIGHVNAGQKNGPAPKEGTGWECDKLSVEGPNQHFAGYIGRLTSATGPLANGLLNGMLLDSWECNTQTWTQQMETEFQKLNAYPLRTWMPSLLGYVIKDPETTTRFLRDWRGTINDLFVNRFFGRMAELGHKNNLTVSYETAAGDVFPADILEYYKYADIPMCEFWQPLSESYVGCLDFKPIKPCASAARMYGKPRVAAEAFTSFALTWNEHFSMLKEVANINIVEGVTHPVFHTYTHNPQIGFLPPGTSFGSRIGTPFLRGQTWWKDLRGFTDYLSRCTYLLERGKPVSDVLWYLGDEINHKPDQLVPFPAGFKYDYCNPDALLTRLSVKDGKIVTPEGISYSVLWMPDSTRMLPQTLEKIRDLVRAGATLIGNPPAGLATLVNAVEAQKRFDAVVQELWSPKSASAESVIRKVGKGLIIEGLELEPALRCLGMTPDVTGGEALWLHRRTEGADWYFVSPPEGKGFKGALGFRSEGAVELWNPVTGKAKRITGKRDNKHTWVTLDLAQAESCFVVFRQGAQADPTLETINTAEPKLLALTAPWTLRFPKGWGTLESVQINELKPWKDLPLTAEARAFSGTATYTTTFKHTPTNKKSRIMLDLGSVDMTARVTLNGKAMGLLWCMPYSLDISEGLQEGDNTLSIDVTSTWHNRLVYDAGLPEDQRKTWTIAGPKKEANLATSGLLGPVMLRIFENNP